jgi:hypothetical protein
VVLLIPPSLTKGMREENQTSAKPTGPTEHAERTMHVTRLDGQRRSLNKKDKTQQNALLEGPNKEFLPCKYISKKLEQPKGWEIKGNKASRMPQQTASQFLSSATTKGVGERSPKSRLAQDDGPVLSEIQCPPYSLRRPPSAGHLTMKHPPQNRRRGLQAGTRATEMNSGGIHATKA